MTKRGPKRKYSDPKEKFKVYNKKKPLVRLDKQEWINVLLKRLEGDQLIW